MFGCSLPLFYYKGKQTSALCDSAIDAPSVNPYDCYHQYFGGSQMQAYCVKCKSKREMKDAKSITMKNGKPATQGVCPTCGTKMFRIGKS